MLEIKLMPLRMSITLSHEPSKNAAIENIVKKYDVDLFYAFNDLIVSGEPGELYKVLYALMAVYDATIM